MVIGVVGSRFYDDYDNVKSVLDILKPGRIVSGGATGADSLAERYAKENDIPTTIHLPRWHQYGKRAAYLRNKKIVDDSEMILAFWDGKSKGTGMTIRLAREAGKGTNIHYI